MVIITHSKEETFDLAKVFSQYLEPGMVIRLDGQLGSGKTTFVQGIGKALNITRAIKSPTYTIVKTYPIDQGQLVHIDAYRLEETDADTIDLPYLMGPDTIVFIEWAEFIEEELPASYLHIQIEYMGETDRRITIVVENEQNNDYDALMKGLDEWNEARA